MINRHTEPSVPINPNSQNIVALDTTILYLRLVPALVLVADAYYLRVLVLTLSISIYQPNAVENS